MERDAAWNLLSERWNEDTRMIRNLPVSKAFAANADTTPHAAEELWRKLSAKQKQDWLERDEEKSEKKRERRRRPKRRPLKEVVAKAPSEEEPKKQKNSASAHQQNRIQTWKRILSERATSGQDETKMVERTKSSLCGSSGDTRKAVWADANISASFFGPSRARQEKLKDFAVVPKSLSAKASITAITDELSALNVADNELDDQKSCNAKKSVGVAPVQRAQNRSPPNFLSSLVVARKSQDKAVKNSKSEVLLQPSTVGPCEADVPVVPVVRTKVVQHQQPSTAGPCEAIVPIVRSEVVQHQQPSTAGPCEAVVPVVRSEVVQHQQPSTAGPCEAVVPVVRSEVVQHQQPLTTVVPSIRSKPKTLPPSLLLRQRKQQLKAILPIPTEKIAATQLSPPKYKAKAVSISKLKSTIAESAVQV